MSRTFKADVSEVVVFPEGSGMHSDSSTRVRIVSEGGGDYVEVEQDRLGKIAIDPDEWPQVRAMIDWMVSRCTGW